LFNFEDYSINYYTPKFTVELTVMQRQRYVASAATRMTLRHYVCSTRRKSRQCPGKSFLA